MSVPRRVIKLGGSLLDWPELPQAFSAWLALAPRAASIVVVGGGAIVESLRQLDKAAGLSAEASHWLAIQAMSLTAALAAERLHGATRVEEFEELQRTGGSGVRIFDVERFLRADAESADPLPCSWEVTSDSIAARLAVRLEAEELVLLKSTLPRRHASRPMLAQDGFVDAYFPTAAESVTVRAVDLRGADFPQMAI